MRNMSILLLAPLLLIACSATNPPKISEAHLQAPIPEDGDIPVPVAQTAVLPRPRPAAKLETYTVVVSDVPVKDLLFSLARDASLNVDIHPGIAGTVTLNAVDQTLPQILNRVAKQVSLRYTIDGPNLVVSPDVPFWRTYKVDYLNVARDSVSEVSVATKIATTGGSVGEGGGGASEEGNVSRTTVTNTSKNDFWARLEGNLRSIIGGGGGESAGATDGAAPSSVVVDPNSGVVNVLGTQRQHEHVQSYVDEVLANAMRQVLIEMSIVEVELSDGYQAGVDWQRISDAQGSDHNGPSVIGSFIGANLASPPFFSMKYNKTTSGGGNISATVRMLEKFGDVKVLSSPKIMVLNNQTAVLKVVDEQVYFSVEQEIFEGTDNAQPRTTYTSTIHTVPVGLVMSVTPQINGTDTVNINVRPTISRITGFAIDPVPRLLGSDFDNQVPEIQVREMESLLQVANGQTVIMGGLMQNKIDKNKSGVPLLSALPVIGSLFSYRDDNLTKTELVIFLRPVVVKSSGAGIEADTASSHLINPGTDRFGVLEEPSSAKDGAS
ncbi:MAG: pilus (MSHA type) biogenesis protein MshL [Gammaproteobacteria bacterium]|nr:pilus (MSHA type) biogenesis protein MshL [Gammaproteobacteria bacterium]